MLPGGNFINAVCLKNMLPELMGGKEFEDFGSNSFFLDEFDRGTEEVVKEPPFIFIKVIKEKNDGWIIEALIT